MMTTPFRWTRLLAALLLVLPVALVAQAPKLIEKFAPKSGELGISYERYALANGLTVLVHVDKSDPVAYVDVTYHVGSAREELGKSGFAHFFEHMMFQGSDNVGDEEHFKIVTSSGGTLNGSTNRDRTNYYQTVPNNQVERMLWLEADRMGFLLDAVTTPKFEVQRATVKNERGQNYDNRPYGLASEVQARTLYPYGHPYSWLTIGYIEDLNRSNLQDLKNFFLRWYGPNNAVLTVAGDVDPKQVVAWADKYFGSIPRGPEVPKMNLEPVKLEADRYTYYEDRIQFPQLAMVWPTVPQGHPDEIPLDAVASVLGQGRSSMLYERLVKPSKAIVAYASHPTSELAGEFTMGVRALPALSLPAAEKEIRAALADFAAKGMTEEQLANFKAEREAVLIYQLTSVQAKGATMASNFTYFGDPNRMDEELAAIRKLTLADVTRVFNQYIKGKGAVITSVVPVGKADQAAKPGEIFRPDSSRNAFPKINYDGLTYTKAKDKFDRSKRPESGPNPTLKVPKFWTQKTANGMTLIGARTTEVPMFSILLNLEGGRRQEALYQGKAGLSNLTAGMMTEGTQQMTAAELAERLKALGAEIDFYSSDEVTTMVISGLTKNLDATLALAKDYLFSPRFAEEDFTRLKRQTVAAIQNQSTQPTVIASNLFDQILLGEGHPLAGSSLGTAESVERVTLDDVKAFYEQNYTPAGASVTIVGDVTEQEIVSKLGFLTNWSKTAVKLADVPAMPKVERTRIYLVNKEGAAQSEIRIGQPGLTYDATGDYYRFGLSNYPLGGAFNSRINLLMREEKGWTYGARSFMSGGKYLGRFQASAGVLKTATDSSVAAVMDILKRYQKDGVTAEELEFMKQSIGQSEARNYESNFQKANFLSRIPRYNLPANFVEQQNAILKNATKAELDAIYRKHIAPEQMIIVVVGDKAVVGEPLKKLGYEVVEVDPNGKKISMN